MAISRISSNVGHSEGGVQRTHTNEALRAGMLGGATVWLWILVIGALSGSPLRLAALFGGGITHIVGAPPTAPMWIGVVVFTVLHFIVWYWLADVSVAVLRAATHSPAVLLLAAFVMILLLLALVGITVIFANDGLGAFAWPSIYLGSIVGLTAMWWYLLRLHPEARTELAHVND